MRTVWFSKGPDTTIGTYGSIYRMDALFAGSLFPREPFDCIVHSVYDHALNLRIPGKPLVYTLVTRPAFMHPLAAMLSGPGNLPIQFHCFNLSPGQAGYFNGQTLYITAGMEISFANVHRIPQIDEVPPPLGLTAGALKDRVSEAGALLEQFQMQQDTELRWLARRHQIRYVPEEGTARSGRFSAAAGSIVRALTDEKPEAALYASLKLVGLGQGLTPSGDDFLCGLALALQMRTTRSRTQVNISSFAVDTWLWDLATKLGTVPSNMADSGELTSMVSKSFLYLASQGCFSNVLVNLARVFADPAQNLKNVLELMSQYGHSSGLDSATGFLFGMTAVD